MIYADRHDRLQMPQTYYDARARRYHFARAAAIAGTARSISLLSPTFYHRDGLLAGLRRRAQYFVIPHIRDSHDISHADAACHDIAAAARLRAA